MISVGNYYGRPIKWGVSEEGTRKTPAFWCEFEITHVSADDKWVPVVEIVTRTVYSYLSDAAFDRSQQKLTVCLGFNGNFQEPEISEKAKDGITLECTHETYNGKDRERWDYPGGERQRQAVGNDEIRKLNALWKRGQTASSETTAGPVGAPTAGPPNPDDAPF